MSQQSVAPGDPLDGADELEGADEAHAREVLRAGARRLLGGGDDEVEGKGARKVEGEPRAEVARRDLAVPAARRAGSYREGSMCPHYDD